MKTWKKVSLGTVALGSAALLAACGSSSSSGAAANQDLNITIPSAVQTMDPTVVTDAYSMTVIGNTQEGLTRNVNGQPELALAKSIETSKDGLTETITLRDGLKWSNGDPITAENFVYSWQRAADPKNASQYAYMIAETNIKNADEIAVGKMPASELGVKAESDTKLVVTLSAPTPYFKNVMALPVFLPLDQKVVEQYGKQYGTSSEKTVYSGPFYFKSGEKNAWTGSNNTVTVVKNPNYWDAKAVKADQITFNTVTDPNTAVQLYKSGKALNASVAAANLYNLYKDNKDVQNLPVSQNMYIEYNQSGKGTTTPEVAKALQNVNIRKAIAFATDRQGLIDTVMPANKPATGFTPAGTGEIDGKDFSDYAKQGWKYDPAQAKSYWEKGLKELGITSLTMNLTTDSDSPVGKQNADFLAKNLETTLPGLTINEHLVPFAQRLKDQQNANFDLIISLWGGDYSEPSTFINMFLPGAGNNDGRVDNAAYNAAIKKATSLPDVLNDSARYADYKDAEKALFDEASVNPIEFYNAPTLVNPKLKGVVRNATGLNSDYKTAYLEK